MIKAMTVRKTIDREVLGLGDKIKEARLRDPRTLADICRQIDMSPMNWYRIENTETKALPLETLRSIEQVLGVDFGVTFEE